MYIVKKDGAECGEHADLGAALGQAEAKLVDLPPGEQATFCVVRLLGDYEELMACFSNRRITGVFYKQAWGGRKGDDAIDCGEEVFDATDAILLLPHEVLIELEDNSESTDRIGCEHINWPGPHYVRITDSICKYFGVSDVEEITHAALSEALSHAKPGAVKSVVVDLSVRLKILTRAPDEAAHVLSEMDYSFVSTTAGAVVVDSEIVGQAWRVEAAEDKPA